MWDQHDIDLATAFIHSRGWRPSKTTAAKGMLVPELHGNEYHEMSYEERDARNNIGEARFTEAGTPGSCGAQKALKRAIKLARGHSRLKDMIAEAEITLAKHMSSCSSSFDPKLRDLKDLLTNIRIAAGG